MVFSRDGKYLLMVGGVPDFKISIYSLQDSKMLLIPDNTSLPCKADEFLQCKFNPANNNQFVILSQTTIYNMVLHPAYKVTEKVNEKKIADSFRIEKQTFKHDNPDLQFTRFIWDQYQRVHVLTDTNLLIQVYPKKCSLEGQMSLSSRPVGIILTQKHLILSLEEGLLQWFQVEPPPLNVLGDKDQQDQKGCTILEEVDQEWYFGVKVGESNVPDYITYLHYSRGFKTLICGTETGVFGTLDIEAEAINEEEEEDE